jgi:ubiquinone/menaquinone biosynthesis C-methylase UbiE
MFMWSSLTRSYAIALTLVFTIPACFAQNEDDERPVREPDIFYVPTPYEVVDAMLKVANVTDSDLVYDLGSGDGRIVIAAARDYSARGIGIDIDPQRTREARTNAEKENVADKVTFVTADIFETDFSNATVVTLYLLTELNLRLKPKLLSELKPGTRVVSHAFSMGDWEPVETLEINGTYVYYWIVP